MQGIPSQHGISHLIVSIAVDASWSSLPTVASDIIETSGSASMGWLTALVIGGIFARLVEGEETCSAIETGYPCHVIARIGGPGVRNGQVPNTHIVCSTRVHIFSEYLLCLGTTIHVEKSLWQACHSDGSCPVFSFPGPYCDHRSVCYCCTGQFKSWPTGRCHRSCPKWWHRKLDGESHQFQTGFPPHHEIVVILCCSISLDWWKALGTYIHTVATSLCTLPAVPFLNPYRIVVSMDLCLCLSEARWRINTYLGAWDPVFLNLLPSLCLYYAASSACPMA